MARKTINFDNDIITFLLRPRMKKFGDSKPILRNVSTGVFRSSNISMSFGDVAIYVVPNREKGQTSHDEAIEKINSSEMRENRAEWLNDFVKKKENLRRLDAESVIVARLYSRFRQGIAEIEVGANSRKRLVNPNFSSP